MACTITITNSVISGGNIIVSGTSDGCKILMVKTVCNGVDNPPQEVVVSFSQGQGSWTATLPACLCGQPITVVASCKATQNGCPQAVAVLPVIPCHEVHCCPVLSYNTSFGPCSEDNTRQVTISYTITFPGGCSDAVYQGQLMLPGTAFSPLPINSSNSSTLSGSIVLTLPIGATQTINLIQNGLPASCDPVSASFTVPNCEDCCPIAIATISSEVAEKCNSDNLTKNVQVSALVTPTPKQNCPSEVQAILLVDDVMVASGSGSAPFTLMHTGDYKCGNHTVTVSYPSSTCPDDGGQFCVSVCESKKCWLRRNLLETAATVGIISLLLFICNYFLLTYSGLNSPVISTVTTPLLILSIAAFAFWIYFYMSWKSLGCRDNCRKCYFLLNAWQIALASLMGFIILGKSSFSELYLWLISLVVQPWIAILIIILLLLIWIIIIILLYISWVAKCCPTKCEKWTLLLDTFLFCAVSFGIIIAVLAFANNAAPALFWLSTWINSLWAIILFLIRYKQKISCV